MPAEFSIWLIDDEPALLPIIQHAAKQVFPEARFTQLTNVTQVEHYLATTGLGAYRPSLVLLDLDLGEDRDGFAVLDLLRDSPHTATVPVVVLTISQLPAHRLMAIDQNVPSFTHKPESLAEWRRYFEILRSYWLQTVRLPLTPA